MVLLSVMIVVAVSSSCLGESQSIDLTAEGLATMSEAYRFFLVLGGTEESPLRYIYADVAAHLHAYAVKNGRSELEWETASLGSPVTSLFLTDVDANGTKDIMVSTARGRIIVYDAVDFERTHENFLDRFESISCMTSANLDNDPQEEVIFIAEGLLNIYDGKNVALEWRSPSKFQATELVVGNVDDDPQPEIILNSGEIVDSRFYTIEPSKLDSGVFGTRIRLFDMNGDGHPEIVGDTPGFALRIYDVYAQREIW
jgi:hypothetical protein